MHSSGGFEAIVANWFGFFGEEVKEFVFLNAFFSDASHNLKFLFRSQTGGKFNDEIETLENGVSEGKKLTDELDWDWMIGGSQGRRRIRIPRLR